MKGPRTRIDLRNGLGPEIEPVKTIGEWRKLPHARNYVQRGQAWELLAWYHHEVVRPQLGFRAWLKRLWWRLRGNRLALMSPWEQLALRERLEARERQADGQDEAGPE